MDVIDELTNLKNVLDTLPGHIYWKTNSGTYLGCNQAFAEYWGEDTPDAIRGKTDEELYFRCWLAEVKATDQIVIRDKCAVTFEDTFDLGNGDKMCGITRKIPLVDAQGNVRGIVGMVEDVTDLPTLPPSLNELWRDSSYGKAREKRLLKHNFIRAQRAELTNIYMGITTAAQCLMHTVTDPQSKELANIILESGQLLFDEHMQLLDET